MKLLLSSLLCLSYLNSHVLVPKYLRRDTWWKYVIGLSGLSLVSFFSGLFLFRFLLSKGYQSGFDEPIDFFDFSLVFHLVVIGISSSLGVSKMAIQSKKQKEKAEKLQKEAELKYLNTQFNPHFLYNTLNSIYAQALEENAEKTTELILQLSEIMRYPIQNVNKEKVLLSDEITFIENFINLQKIRLGEDYPITFDKTGNLQEVKISPFLFIPLVENAFKYGVSQKDKTPISFVLKIEEKQLFFSVQNTIIKQINTASHLTGLTHLKLRLSICYPQNHSLKILGKESDFIVELRIN